MKVPPSIGPNAGFTLVESMLTLAIVSVGLLALAGLQITALRGLRHEVVSVIVVLDLVS